MVASSGPSVCPNIAFIQYIMLKFLETLSSIILRTSEKGLTKPNLSYTVGLVTEKH